MRRQCLAILFISSLLASIPLLAVKAQGGIMDWFRGEPRTYEDCVLRNMAGVTSDTAARAVQSACTLKFHRMADRNWVPPVDVTSFFAPEPLRYVTSATHFSSHFEIYFNHNVEKIEVSSIRMAFSGGSRVIPVVVDCFPSSPVRSFSNRSFNCPFVYDERSGPLNVKIEQVAGRRLP
jgi:hypothetical protein